MKKPEYNALSWPEIIRYLSSNIKNIAIILAIVSVATVIIVLLMDNMYKSTANLLPNKTRSIGFDLFSQDGGLQSIASSVLGGESEENNRFYVLLHSHSTKKKVVEKFNLKEVYDVADTETPLLYAIQTLEERTAFLGREEGNFTIDVWDKDPERAKEMADYYVELLNEFNTEIATKEAREFRKFIEKRYQKSLHDIDSLRTKMAHFQARYGVFELPEQVKSYFEIISELTRQKYETSITLNLLGRSVRPSNDKYQQAKNRLEVVDQQLTEVYNDTLNKNLLLNFNELPEIGTQYFNLLKEIEIQTEIQKFIVPLYEQAKMQEAKSLPIVTIVDPPHVPVKKSYPSRSKICILAFLSTLLLAVIYYILKLHWKKNRTYYQYLVGYKM